MNIRKWEVVSWVAVLALTVIFAVLNRFIPEFKIVTVIMFSVLMLMIAANRAFAIGKIKKNFDDGLEVYLLQMLNLGYITRTQFDERDEAVIKGYYKNFRLARKKQILLIIGIMIVTASLISVYITAI